MNLITGLTDQPKQQTSIIIADGSRATLLLEYRPNQACWVFDLIWGAIEIRGGQFVAFPNMLRQFRHRLPFGLACITAGNIDPVDQESFVNGAASLYLLDSTEVAAVEAAVFPGD